MSNGLGLLLRAVVLFGLFIMVACQSGSDGGAGVMRGGAPAASQPSVLDISQTSRSITLLVAVASEASALVRMGACYSTTEMPSIDGVCVEASDNQQRRFTLALTALSPETAYFIQAFVETANDIVYTDAIAVMTEAEDAPDSPSDNGLVAPGEPGALDVCSYTPPDEPGYRDARIFHPCSGAGPYPAVTLSSGLNGVWSGVSWLANHLTSHGFVVLAVTPEVTNVINTLYWSTAHLSAANRLLAENSREGDNPLQGMIDTERLALIGFSMGGGGVLVAGSALGERVKAVISLAPYLPAADLSGMTAATAIFIGVDDGKVSVSEAGDRYDELPQRVDRTLGIFNDFPHNVWGSSGSENDHETGARYITAFLQYQLNNNVTYYPYIYGELQKNDLSDQVFYLWRHNRDR